MACIDEELGIDPQEGFRVGERLSPVLQTMVDQQAGDIEVVLVTLGEAFFIALRSAGASSWQIEKWSKRAYGKLGLKSNFAVRVQGAYEPIGAEITAMIAEGFDPLAIAWSLAGAILRIGRQIGISDAQYDWLAENLIMYINDTRETA